MQKMTCEQTRRELDELNLSDELSEATGSHLNDCVECQAFQRSQLKLRQLVKSLGTVQAPADFDFKLRARLASEPAASGFQFWHVAKWSLTAVGAVVLFIGGFSVVRQLTQPPSPAGLEVVASGPSVAQTPSPVTVQVPQLPATTRSETEGNLPAAQDYVASAGDGDNPKRVIKSSGVKSAKPSAVRESASEIARVEPVGARDDVVFAVDASGKPLTVSVDDGRGNAKTISLPTITFGSQRVINNNHFAAKGVW